MEIEKKQKCVIEMDEEEAEKLVEAISEILDKQNDMSCAECGNDPWSEDEATLRIFVGDIKETFNNFGWKPYEKSKQTT